MTPRPIARRFICGSRITLLNGFWTLVVVALDWAFGIVTAFCAKHETISEGETQ